MTDEEIDEAIRRTQGLAPQQPEAEAKALVQPVTRATPEVSVQAGGQQPTYTWLHTALGTAVLACATYGLGSIAYPHAMKAWKWLTKAHNQDSESDTADSKLVKLLTNHIQQQEEMTKDIRTVVRAVKDVQVRS